MKQLLFLGLSLCAACSSDKPEHSITEKSLSPAKIAAPIRSAYEINHGRCYEKTTSIKPIIQLSRKIVLAGEPVTGMVYYPTQYYKRLAKCYNVTYETRLLIMGSSPAIVAQRENQDTIKFSINPNELEILSREKQFNRYKLYTRLVTRFTDSTGAFISDTTGPATSTMFLVNRK
jgi:hypothetical protein